VVLIDEVQRVPSLLDVVHQQLEARAGDLRFVMTGSSSRKLKHAGVNLLAGRATLRSLHPFMAAELDQAFELERALEYGLLPLVSQAVDPRATRDAYLALYVREEVQAEGLVRDLGAFSRFLEAVSMAHGSVLNISAVARDCSVSRKTVEGYLSIVEDLLLSFRVPVFTRSAKRRTVVHPKFYFFDVGVYRAARPQGPLDSADEISGAALEGLVAQHLRAWVEYSNAGASLYYWRTPSGSEVDFVVYGGEVFYAVEVKNTRRPRSRDTAALRTFKRDYPEARVALVYRGEERSMVGGVLCLPVDEFLRGLRPGHQILDG